MARRFDLEKQRQWEQRIERHRASGLTVVRFCTEEDVSVKAFYYWAKRLGERVRRPHIAPVVKAPEKKRPSAQQAVARVQGAVTNTAVVRFRLNAAVEISVPADCLEAIRCLANCVQHMQPQHSAAFHELVVAPR